MSNTKQNELEVSTVPFITANGNLWVAFADLDGVKIATGSMKRDEAKTKLVTGKYPVVGRPEWYPELGATIRKDQIVPNNLLASPMLVVGSHSYMRSIVPSHVLEFYDIHILFMPSVNPAGYYKVGLVAFNRKNINAEPMWVWDICKSTVKGIQDCLAQFAAETHLQTLNATVWQEIHPKLGTWNLLALYRFPKIALKDVLHLEEYK